MTTNHLKLPALVVDAMIADDRGDETEAGVGGVDAHVVDAIEHKLEDVGEDLGMIDVRGSHAVPEDRELGGDIGIAAWGLGIGDAPDDGIHKRLAALPLLGDGAAGHLSAQPVDVDDLRDVADASGHVAEAIANLFAKQIS